MAGTQKTLWKEPELWLLVKLVKKKIPNTMEECDVVRGLHSCTFATNYTATVLSKKFKDLY
jgi:hypothetical protein